MNVVRRGGSIRILCNGAHTDFYSESRVVAGIQEARYVQDAPVKVVCGPAIVPDETGFHGLSHLSRNGTILLYLNPDLRVQKDYFLVETKRGLLVGVEDADFKLYPLGPGTIGDTLIKEFESLVQSLKLLNVHAYQERLQQFPLKTPKKVTR